jgi:hypothetical protein
MRSVAARKPKRRAQIERAAPCPRLLYRRDEAAAMLGVSPSTLICMEADGRLPKHSMGRKKNSVAVYRASDIYRLAGITAADALAILKGRQEEAAM